ncbi:MAG: hypothetical protein ACPGR2_10440 [Psychrobium sp.]
MLDYKFAYKDSEIKVSISLMGLEEVFVNNKRVSSSSKWVLHNTHDIVVEDTQLQIRVDIESITTGEVAVSLYQEAECIASQSQGVDAFGKPISITAEEKQWQKEIKINDTYKSLAYSLYFLLLIIGIVVDTGAGDKSITHVVAPALLIAITGIATFLFFKEGIAILNQKEE